MRTCTGSGPRPMGGCSAAPAVACSAKASTAAPGTLPAMPRSPRPWPAPGLARRPYDLRHAALSLWLNAATSPAEVAARAGNSVRVLHTVYTHCIDGHADVVSQQIEHALQQQDLSPLVTASGSSDRRHRCRPVRHMSVNGTTGLDSGMIARPESSWPRRCTAWPLPRRSPQPILTPVQGPMTRPHAARGGEAPTHCVTGAATVGPSPPAIRRAA